MALTLTIDGYLSLPERDVFDAWLEDQGLRHQFIFEATFGEGVLEAKCYSRNAEGRRYIATYEPEPVVATERRTFTLTKPPPQFVLDYCI